MICSECISKAIFVDSIRTVWTFQVLILAKNPLSIVVPRSLVRAAIAEWEGVTCIRFLESEENDRKALHFRAGDGYSVSKIIPIEEFSSVSKY